MYFSSCVSVLVLSWIDHLRRSGCPLNIQFASADDRNAHTRTLARLFPLVNSSCQHAHFHMSWGHPHSHNIHVYAYQLATTAHVVCSYPPLPHPHPTSSPTSTEQHLPLLHPLSNISPTQPLQEPKPQQRCSEGRLAAMQHPPLGPVAPFPCTYMYISSFFRQSLELHFFSLPWPLHAPCRDVYMRRCRYRLL